MTQTERDMTELVRASLWGTPCAKADESVFQEMIDHAVFALPAAVLPRLDVPDDLRAKWKTEIFRQISFNVRYTGEQAALPIDVPYVILKGTEAAKYYPAPLYRVMGDIDVMTRREDYDAAYGQLLQGGYRAVNTLERERGFVKNGVMLELHRSFALLNDPKAARFLDDLILENINDSHSLPDDVNGLVILEHISQHMESGIGLRQVVDWMMFVHKCLPDEKWPAFEQLAEKIGMTRLAKAVTRTCEIFLGLPEHAFCADTDGGLCERLMEHVLTSGNFGAKQQDESDVTVSILTRMRSPSSALRLLYRNGCENWKAAQEHPFLRPLAVFYQMGRYVKKAVKRGYRPSEFAQERAAAERRNELFDELGIRQYAKGWVAYKDGEYTKK